MRHVQHTFALACGACVLVHWEQLVVHDAVHEFSAGTPSTLRLDVHTAQPRHDGCHGVRLHVEESTCTCARATRMMMRHAPTRRLPRAQHDGTRRGTLRSSDETRGDLPSSAGRDYRRPPHPCRTRTRPVYRMDPCKRPRTAFSFHSSVRTEASLDRSPNRKEDLRVREWIRKGRRSVPEGSFFSQEGTNTTWRPGR